MADIPWQISGIGEMETYIKECYSYNKPGGSLVYMSLWTIDMACGS